MAALLSCEFGLVGVNGIDFVLQGDQVYPVEVNPRYSASMELIEQAYGLSMFDLHLRAVLNGELPKFDLAAELSQGDFYGKSILFAESDALAPETQGWFERGIRDVPTPKESLSRGAPICTVLASGATRGDCYRALVARTEMIKREIYG
jgi:predicted ATP-grasp superfamily ATP-dependent carboligase